MPSRYRTYYIRRKKYGSKGSRPSVMCGRAASACQAQPAQASGLFTAKAAPAVDTAVAAGKDYELWDTIVPGFFCKITAHGRKVFMTPYRANLGERRKPKTGRQNLIARLAFTP